VVKKILPLLILLASVLPVQARAQSPSFDAEILERAVAEKPPRWKFVRGTRYRELPETFAMQLVAIAAAQHPNHQVGGTTLAASLATKVQFFLRNHGPDADGNTHEPEAQGGIGGWSHNAAAWALLIAKQTPEVWTQLTADDRRRADILMRALAIGGHFTHGDANDYSVLLDGISWYQKSWNPNHIEGYIGVMIAAAAYFGADELNAFFHAFDYAEFRQELQAVQFHNILQTWENIPAMAGLLMNGGSYQYKTRPVGHGRGVRQDFTYRGRPLQEPWEIYLTQADRLWSKTVRTVVGIHGDQSSRLLNHASDATVSPYEGRMGMVYEFEAMDSRGLRTSLGYAYDCVMVHLGTAAGLKVTGQWHDDATGRDVEERMAVGMADLIFKAAEGYEGWANGRPSVSTLADLKQIGSDYIFELWRGMFPAPTELAVSYPAPGSVVTTQNTLFADDNVYPAWPDIIRAGNGDLLATFCSTDEHLGPDGKAVMMRSTDNGQTWSDPVTIYDSPLDDRDIGLSVAPDGTLALHIWSTFWTEELYSRYNEEHYPLETLAAWTEHVNQPAYRAAEEDQGRWVLTSRDHGYTWGERVRGPDAVHGGIVLQDGTWMTVAYRDEQGDLGVYTAPESIGPWVKSTTLETPTSAERRFGEPHVAQLPSGRIVVLIRATAIPYDDQGDGLHMWGVVSDDNGATWSAPFSTGRWGFPPHLTVLSDGRLLATYGYRRFPYGQRAALSSDGVNWQETAEFVLRADAPNHDLGYPASIEVAPGEILTIYYQETPETAQSHSRPTIQSTRWLLPDID
jgi:sialidase-1